MDPGIQSLCNIMGRCPEQNILIFVFVASDSLKSLTFGLGRISEIFEGYITTQKKSYPTGPSGESLEELKTDMEFFLQALDRPVLRKEEIEFAEMGE